MRSCSEVCVSVRPLVARLPARWSFDDARGVLAAFEASGLSIAEFARQEAIDPQRLYMWRRKVGAGALGRGASATGPRLVEVHVRQPRTASPVGIEVTCPSGHVVRVADRASIDALAEVLRAVEAASC